MFLQVKYTSALTNTISGTAKACVQTLLAAIIFRNPISVTVSPCLLQSVFVNHTYLHRRQNGIGILLALVGSGYYGYVRFMERVSK